MNNQSGGGGAAAAKYYRDPRSVSEYGTRTDGRTARSPPVSGPDRLRALEVLEPGSPSAALAPYLQVSPKSTNNPDPCRGLLVWRFSGPELLAHAHVDARGLTWAYLQSILTRPYRAY